MGTSTGSRRVNGTRADKHDRDNVDVEVAAKPRARRFAAEYKLRVLQEAEELAKVGGVYMGRSEPRRSWLTNWGNRMGTNVSKALGSWTVGVLLAVAFGAEPAAAVPLPTGACCSLFTGCCPPEGSCSETTLASCSGLGVTYIGGGTTCAGQCAGTTTTTLLSFGACCLFGGGCNELTSKECNELGDYAGDDTTCEFTKCALPTTTTTLPPIGGCCLPGGSCVEDSPAVCAVNEGSYQGDGTTCVFLECSLSTTTTTLPPIGGCCLPGGNCVEDRPEVCAVNEGSYQGDGTTCVFLECPLPTTTTLPLVVICGDANDDKDITAADALIALKTGVGSAMCSLEACDYNGGGTVTSGDALLILKVAVGQVIVPMCPVVI